MINEKKIILKMADFIKENHRENQKDQEMSDEHIYIVAYNLMNDLNIFTDEKEKLIEAAFLLAVNANEYEKLKNDDDFFCSSYTFSNRLSEWARAFREMDFKEKQLFKYWRDEFKKGAKLSGDNLKAWAAQMLECLDDFKNYCFGIDENIEKLLNEIIKAN